MHGEMIHDPSSSPREKLPGDVSEGLQDIGAPCMLASVPADLW